MLDYLANILVFVGIYALFASSLSFAAGYAGLVSVGQAAFYGVGAYTSALAATKLGAPFPLAVLSGALCAAVCGAVASWPAIRLRGDFLLLGTLAFSQLIMLILKNWVSLTNGPAGITGIPFPRFLNLDVDPAVSYLLLVIVIVSMCIWLERRLIISPFGRVLEAIRDDEVSARALSINIISFKLRAFIISAAFTGVAGALYAHYVTFINPDTFGINESVLVLVMVIIGGSASLRGSVMGAAVLIILPEILRFTPLPTAAAASIRQMIYGGLLAAVIIIRPQGLFGGDKRISLSVEG